MWWDRLACSRRERKLVLAQAVVGKVGSRNSWSVAGKIAAVAVVAEEDRKVVQVVGEANSRLVVAVLLAGEVSCTT